MTRRFSWIGDDTQRTLKRLAMSGLTGLFVAGAYALLSPSWYTARISVVSLKRSATPAIPGLAELRELGGSLPGVPSSDAERIAAVLSSESVANAVVSNIAAIRAQRVAKELELSYAKGFASREESSSVQLRHMLSVLEAKERALEGGTSRDQTSDGGSAPLTAPELLPPAMAVPSLRAQLEELHLDRKFYETADLMTMQRLETAKANQAREISTFQILDSPTLPTYPSRPSRLLLLMVGLIIE